MWCFMDARTLLKIINFYARFTPDYTKIGYFARKLTWSKESPPSFSGQHWLVTGASSGLGKALMIAAVEGGASVIAVSSNREKLNSAIAEIDPLSQKLVTPIVADMSLKHGTEQLLSTLVSEGHKIDVLHNNVGVLFNELELTDEGRETTYVINVMSHYLMTKGLVEADALNRGAVVVNMTSGGMYNAPLSTTGLNNTDPKTYNGKVAYAYAKRAQVALTDYWNEIYGDRNISFYVTHPGWTKTPGVKEALPIFWILQNPILRSPRQGCDTALWLCTTRPEVKQDVVWFDRKARPTHIFEFTKAPRCSLEELANYFDKDIEHG